MSTEPTTGPHSLPPPIRATYRVRCMQHTGERNECVHDFGVIAGYSAADASRIARERVMRGEVWVPIRLCGGLEWEIIVAADRPAEP